jgi:U3 small nucleolar RNA-associated protein 20
MVLDFRLINCTRFLLSWLFSEHGADYALLINSHHPLHPFPVQLRFLLSWLFSDRGAEDSSEVGPAFALLRAILGRRLVVPEVYDVMTWVQDLMVK